MHKTICKYEHDDKKSEPCGFKDKDCNYFLK